MFTGDEVLKYESRKYKTQRLIAFSNHSLTDPFAYSEEIKKYFTKIDKVDVENIYCTEKVISGHFASYHAYPYFPDFLKYAEDWTPFGVTKEEFGENTYRAYLSALTKHHTMPVVIAEFGTTTARTAMYSESNSGIKSGRLSEQEQGEVLAKSYEDIVTSGANGACVYSWHDEWCKRTWNTMHAVDLRRSAFWSDVQTGEQFFGLLSFDPGKEESVCYVDGDVSEWTEKDKIVKGNHELSYKYDEKFLYFLVKKENLDFENETLYIPIDLTPKSGSNYCEEFDLKFDRDADFVIALNGAENSRMLVHERYNALRSTYSTILYKYNTYQKARIPDVNNPHFVPIELLLEKVKFEDVFIREGKVIAWQAQGNDEELAALRKPVSFETGTLTHGNANPESPDFNSLADFCVNGDYIEIKIPWQILNFADPSRMEIHDDYYDGNYGVEYINIDKIYAGIGIGNERIELSEINLKGRKVQFIDKDTGMLMLSGMLYKTEDKGITWKMVK